MSKRKPKAKRPTYGELYMEKVYGPWMHAGAAKVNPREVLAALEKDWTERKARWDEEAHGPRSVPDDCARPVVFSISEAADFIGVNGHSSKFKERYIANGRLAANKVSRQRWKFDLDELEREHREEEARKKRTRARRKLGS